MYRRRIGLDDDEPTNAEQHDDAARLGQMPSLQ
jgi:hypothetical protein